MQRIAVFGNAGGGKSTLARQLAEITGLPLFVLDLIEFRDGRYWPQEKGGGKISPDAYRALHAELIARDRWIIDGYGSVASAWERFSAADTLVHVDRPLPVHYLWVTKRLVKGVLRNPKGWPEGSPVWESSFDSYKVIGRCHRHLTPKYRQLVAEMAASKAVYRIRTNADVLALLDAAQKSRLAT